MKHNTNCIKKATNYRKNNFKIAKRIKYKRIYKTESGNTKCCHFFMRILALSEMGENFFCRKINFSEKCPPGYPIEKERDNGNFVRTKMCGDRKTREEILAGRKCERISAFVKTVGFPMEKPTVRGSV